MRALYPLLFSNVFILISITGFSQKGSNSSNKKVIMDFMDILVPGADYKNRGHVLDFNYRIIDERKKATHQIGRIFLKDCSSIDSLDSLLKQMKKIEAFKINGDSIEQGKSIISIGLSLKISLNCLVESIKKIEDYSSSFIWDPRSSEILVFYENTKGK